MASPMEALLGAGDGVERLVCAPVVVEGESPEGLSGNRQVARVRRSKPAHPFQFFRTKEGRKLDEQQRFEKCVDYLKDVEQNCRLLSQPEKGHSPFTKCDCIAFLANADKQDEREGIATFMMDFFEKRSEERQRLVIEWIRYTNDDKSKRKFFLPITDRVPEVLGEEEEEEARQYSLKIREVGSRKICKAALGYILHVQRHTFETAVTSIRTNIIPQHGNKFRVLGKGKRFEEEIKPAFDDFMTELSKLAEPTSTKAVRDVTGNLTLKDAKDGVLYLPPSMSKRKIYESFCQQRGNIMALTDKGYIVSEREAESKPIPAWSTFLSYWKKHYPKLRVGTPNEHGSSLPKEVSDSMHKFLQHLMETNGAPKGTGIVKLPPNLTKRNLYITFIEARGWTAKTTAQGMIEPLPKLEEEQRKICRFSTFQNYWSTAFPKLRVSRPPKTPKLNSFLLPPPYSASKLEKKALEWLSSESFMKAYADSFVPIIPRGNDVRMSHQTPQAMRIFFSAPVDNNEGLEDSEEYLYSYGPLAVLRSTGFDPNKSVKARPFCEKLKEIVDLLADELRNHLRTDPNYTCDLDFNHVEVKIYHGEKIYLDENGNPLLDDKGRKILVKCNYKVNFHSDLCFKDSGEQDSSDTARGDHPIATLTIGAARKLTFKHKWKSGSGWSDGKEVDFSLQQGSIFFLLPNDEKPKLVENFLHKTQHMAQLTQKGVSFALVFRSVKKTSVFDKETHRWKWKKEDENCKKTVKSHVSRKAKEYKGMERKTTPKEVIVIMKNVSKYLRRVKQRERFRTSQDKDNNNELSSLPRRVKKRKRFHRSQDNNRELPSPP